MTVKQRVIKYHFLSLWYDVAVDWTRVSRIIGEHVTHKAKEPVRRGDYDKFPDFLRMGTFIDSTHIKL